MLQFQKKELSNQEMIINVSKSVMELNLANGKITPEIYMETLKNAIAYDYQLAVHLKQEKKVLILVHYLFL